ncbi:MAG: hypothetical protein Q8W46_02920 [Candidatus Palauibacterales bacterium]|nr:hypothetical protein [Candidatus Palauibacterales bacterium]
MRLEVASVIRKAHPEWSSDKFICREDLNDFRGKYVHSLLESEKGELSTLEHDVVRSLQEHELLSSNIEAEFEQKWSFGERLADRIATRLQRQARDHGVRQVQAQVGEPGSGRGSR